MRPTRFDYDLSQCGIKRALDVLGEKWTLLILREAVYGVRRFDDFARALGCGRGVLSSRLKALTAAGVLERVPYSQADQRPRAEYRLTDKGRDLFPALLALSQWADRWAPGADGPVAEVMTRAGGRPVAVTILDDRGQGPLSLRDIRVKPGPGAKPLNSRGSSAAASR